MSHTVVSRLERTLDNSILEACLEVWGVWIAVVIVHPEM